MMKKRLAVLLCGAMLLGTGSVAFAEENTDAQATEAEASSGRCKRFLRQTAGSRENIKNNR